VLSVPVEIRDVLPTLAAAAGSAVPNECDGQPLLRADRAWIDLEHDVCYDPSNHWNALTDGRWKYIYHAQDGREQLFDLAADPHELKESGDEEQLRLWRGRLTAHLAPRGEEWVRGGRLVPRPQGRLYSPHYPEAAAGG
jgi:arylsulfatase A-like enzyme